MTNNTHNYFGICKTTGPFGAPFFPRFRDRTFVSPLPLRFSIFFFFPTNGEQTENDERRTGAKQALMQTMLSSLVTNQPNHKICKTNKNQITKKQQNPDLIQQEVGIQEILRQIMRATRAIALVLQMRDNTHVAEAVPAGRQEGVLDRPHADRAQQILPDLRLLRRRGFGHSRRGDRRRRGERGPVLRLGRRD